MIPSTQKQKKRSKADEKEKTSFQRLHEFFSSSSTESTSSQSMVCENDQCSIRPISVTPPTSANLPTIPLDPMRAQWEKETSLTPSNVRDECSMEPTLNSTITIEDEHIPGTEEEIVIQPELTEALLQAIKIGSISCFVLTPILDRLTEYLKNNQYTPTQVAVITQAIRSLAIISLGTSPQIAISLPIINFLLTEYAKVTPQKANLLAAGSLLLSRIYMNPLGAGVTLATTVFAFGFNFGGNKISRKIGEGLSAALHTDNELPKPGLKPT